MAADASVDWTLEEVQGRSVEAIRDDLLGLNRSFLEGRLEEEVERNIAGKSDEEIIEWAEKRFGRAWSDRNHGDLNGDLKAELLVRGRELLRWELSKLEQFVLLRIYDQAWKDHLLEMDHLKSAIMQRPLGGDTAHPQSQFSIEGRDLCRHSCCCMACRMQGSMTSKNTLLSHLSPTP